MPQFSFRALIQSFCISFLLSFFSIAISLSAETTDLESTTLSFLRSRLVKDGIYPRMDCIMILSEENDSRTVSFALREIHNELCGGDPDLAPIVDRYRVDAKKKRIEWYSALEDEYLPYSEFLKSKKAKKE